MPAGSPGVIARGTLKPDFDKSVFSDFSNPVIHFFIKGPTSQKIGCLIALEPIAEVFCPPARNLEKVEAKLTLKNGADGVDLGRINRFFKTTDEIAA